MFLSDCLPEPRTYCYRMEIEEGDFPYLERETKEMRQYQDDALEAQRLYLLELQAQFDVAYAKTLA